MESPTAPVAPAPLAPVETPVTIAPDVAAANTGDVQGFLDARAAQRTGKPLPAVEAPETPAAPAAPTLSKRQQDANERTREAVALATADIRAENARLKAQLDAPRAVPPAPPAPAPTEQAEPEFKRYLALPGAPKLADFDSVEEHAIAAALFINRAVASETQSRASQDELTAAQHARVETFIGRLNETKAADPEFVNKLTPDVKALKPFNALAPGEPSGPRNVIAEKIYDSPVAPALLLHFSQHPEALAGLETMPASIAALPPAVRARAHIQHIIRAFGALEGQLATAATPTHSPAQPQAVPSSSPISTAPQPPPVLTTPGSTSDPKIAAIARRDVGSFLEIRKQERRAAMRDA